MKIFLRYNLCKFFIKETTYKEQRWAILLCIFLDAFFNSTWSFFVSFQLMIDIVFKITVMINLLT